MSEDNTKILNIIAWVCFGASILWWPDLAIIGAIVGFFHRRETGKGASFWANIIWLGIQFLLGFFFAMLFF